MSTYRNKPQVLLGSDSHVMAWNPQLNIYRVNRYKQQFSLDDKLAKWKYEDSRLDFIEELLMRNLDHCTELIISFLGFQDQLRCLPVCHLWNEFIAGPVFRRRIERLVGREEGLVELAEQEGWSREEQEGEESVNKRVLARVFLLRDSWRMREPRARRLFCDSFVLSLRADDATILCGLNNGCVQEWDVATLARIKEQECHQKGVKCIDMNSKVFLTGSYDTTFKVWHRESWSCLATFPLHTDSVWDLRLHGTTVATAGLDGTVILYDFLSEYELKVRSYIQADGDLVSAVDFSSDYLCTGHEDSYIAVWRLPGGVQLHTLTGHTGGVTGISLQGRLAASSSYDTTVKLWEVEAGTCLKTFTESENFVRCIALHGQRIVSGDFAGMVFMWDFHLSTDGQLKVTNQRQWEFHKGHVVCIHLSAARIVTGSRDKTLMLSDFWSRAAACLGPRASGRESRHSRFLNRDILSL